MTPEEADEIIRRLNLVLREAGLAWVVQQVAAVVERGVDESTHFTFQNFELDQPAKRPGPKSEALTTRAYTEEEELRILIAAIRSAVIDRYQIEESAFERLKTETIAFYPDLPTGFADRGYDRQVDEEFKLTLANLKRRRDAIQELEAHLAELEALLHA